MLYSVLLRNKQLCQELGRLTGQLDASAHNGLAYNSPVDVVITANEINDKHGTGALVSRIFQGCTNILSIRSRNDYGGEHTFGEMSICLPGTGLSRPHMFQEILCALDGRMVKRVVCIPYASKDLLASIAVTELFEAPLCTYIMDDQNICCSHIPDKLMGEFLSKCTLRLTTHPEMRDAYESKYGLKFWLLPAVVPGHLVRSTPVSPASQSQSSIGALVGSIWSEKWFEQVRNTLKGSGYSTQWYGNNNSPYFKTPADELSEANITAFGLVPEERLAELLCTHPYAIVPTGTPDDTGNALALAKLSLPGRILFIVATSHTPVIVLGDEETPAARFVKRFGVGVVSDYNPKSFRKTVQEILSPQTQLTMRQNAARIAQSLSAEGIGEWLWQSLEKGEPHDSRFETLLPRLQSDPADFIEPPVPKDIHREYVAIYHVMRRLKNNGYNPDFVIDVGAARGTWSDAVSRLFSNARFILVDPLISKYGSTQKQFLLKRIPRCELVEVALSNQSGTVSFQVSPDLYGSSLLQPGDYRSYDTIQVKTKTLDQLAKEKNIVGRGIVKIDVQFTEHLVLEGAREFLAQVDAIVVEMSLVRYHEKAELFPEMLALMNNLGFRYYDDAGSWRSPVNGALLQKDVVFLRIGLFEFEASS